MPLRRIDIPADLLEEAQEWRERCSRPLPRHDALMEKFFDDPDSIMRETVAIRKGTLSMRINPMICGSSFKNKVQTLLSAVCACPARSTPGHRRHTARRSRKEVVRHPPKSR